MMVIGHSTADGDQTTFVSSLHLMVMGSHSVATTCVQSYRWEDILWLMEVLHLMDERGHSTPSGSERYFYICYRRGSFLQLMLVGSSSATNDNGKMMMEITL